jgi:hypothetical protein
MRRAVLEEIADQLDGTDDSLGELLYGMGLYVPAFEVETEMEHRLDFGYCQRFALWSDGVRNGACDVCGESDGAIW